jgi:hypothetical protein
MNDHARDEREREGGGEPADRRDDDRASSERVAGTSPTGSEASVVNRRDLPGGSFQPARTPGAMGPTTRETDRSVSDETKDALVGRTEVAGEIRKTPEMPNKPKEAS